MAIRLPDSRRNTSSTFSPMRQGRGGGRGTWTPRCPCRCASTSCASPAGSASGDLAILVMPPALDSRRGAAVFDQAGSLGEEALLAPPGVHDVLDEHLL
eukprot:5710128-Alexandrium_andersonii.AAC.1